MSSFSLRRFLNACLLLGVAVFLIQCTSSRTTIEYVVAKTGSDSNPGTAEQPFLTINKAAQQAHAGDVITVREGIYREWVKPLRGGKGEDARITYRAAEGEDVRILGSERATGWTNEGHGLWRVELKPDFFGDFNPFATLIACLTNVKKIGGTFTLCCMPLEIRNVMELANVMNFFQVYATEEEAVAAV